MRCFSITEQQIAQARSKTPNVYPYGDGLAPTWSGCAPRVGPHLAARIFERKAELILCVSCSVSSATKPLVANSSLPYCRVEPSARHVRIGTAVPMRTRLAWQRRDKGETNWWTRGLVALEARHLAHKIGSAFLSKIRAARCGPTRGAQPSHVGAKPSP